MLSLFGCPSPPLGHLLVMPQQAPLNVQSALKKQKQQHEVASKWKLQRRQPWIGGGNLKLCLNGSNLDTIGGKKNGEKKTKWSCNKDLATKSKAHYHVEAINWRCRYWLATAASRRLTFMATLASKYTYFLHWHRELATSDTFVDSLNN